MSRSRNGGRCGRDCAVCNLDKLKGHRGDGYMKPSDKRRSAGDDEDDPQMPETD